MWLVGVAGLGGLAVPVGGIRFLGQGLERLGAATHGRTPAGVGKVWQTQT
jgi:hypothetical protein